jgi:hypothetical protein
MLDLWLKDSKTKLDDPVEGKSLRTHLTARVP